MIIENFVVHVLDKDSDFPILNDHAGRISPEIDKFFQKVTNKILKDDGLRKAKFNDYNNNIVGQCCEQMIYDNETFLRNSQEIASYMFEHMKINGDIESCDLAIYTFNIKDEKYVGVVKLDYKKLYTHKIELENDKFNIQMIDHNVGIPENSKPKQAAVIGMNGMNDEYHLKVLDKIAEKEGEDTKFTTDFLNVEKVIDDSYLTRKFKEVTDNWITNSLGADVKKAEDARSLLNYTLRSKEEINVNEISTELFDDVQLRESFKESLEDHNIEEEFGLDKSWIEKKLKRREMKTSNGFNLKALLDDFEDPMKFSVRKNENGTIDIVIKNVEFIEG